MKFNWPWNWKKENRSGGQTIATAGWLPQFGLGDAAGRYGPERAGQLVVVHRCVQLIAESLSHVPCRVYREMPDGGREIARELPLYSVLQDQFNENMNAFEGREFLLASVLYHGNAYAKKIYDGAGQVISLLPMAPTSIGVERLPNGRLRYTWTRPDGSAEILIQDEVLHIRYRTRDGYIGISPIQHAAKQTSLALHQLDAAHTQAERDFRPAGALMLEQKLNPEQRKQARENFGDILTGTNKRNSLILLEAGAKFQPFSPSNKDVEFIESRKLANLDLCRIYGVPPSAVGITDNATYSNIGEESRALVVRCLAPMAARFEQAMNAQLLSPDARKNLFIEHDLAGLQRGDIGTRYTAYKTAREAGILSVNEIRKFENLPKIPGGDEYLSPLNMAIAGSRTEPQNETEPLDA